MDADLYEPDGIWNGDTHRILQAPVSDALPSAGSYRAGNEYQLCRGDNVSQQLPADRLCLRASDSDKRNDDIANRHGGLCV